MPDCCHHHRRLTLGFSSLLTRRWETSQSLLCVGLDPDVSRLPAGYSPDNEGIEWFLTDIIDATADFVCAFKPQIAYFAATGAERQLEKLCAYIRDNYPDIPIILDAKRGDIGDTARMYAREAFDRYGAHAVTVNPYMGTDTIEPYLTHPQGAAVVLCRTSNAGSGDFQSQEIDGRPLYVHVAERAATQWATVGDVSLVVGATYPDELATVRGIVGEMTLLVPGVGAQGGDPDVVVRNGANSTGTGLVVNSSRAILYADGGIAGSAREAERTRDALRAAL
ncbi:MAG: orotidine-5-phosphate decarboxylase [Actinomycetota bacterium]